MGYDRRVLQHFLLGFEGTRVPAALRTLLRGGLAGVAIYKRNWETAEGLRALCDEIRQAVGSAQVLIGIDQEGGTKFSLPEPFTQWRSPAQLGQAGDAGVVEKIGEAMARELRAAGVNLNFAPMLDVHVHPGSPVTSVRSFGGDPQKVGELGAAFIRGLWKKGGVLACAKHYPGHGDVGVDPHDEMPVSEAAQQILEGRDLPPFAAAIQAGVPVVMTAHILLKTMESVPASLSRHLLHEVLRRRMGFGGVILADDLGMGAIRSRYGVEKAAVMALQAGSDILMLCHDWSLVQPGLTAVQRGRETYLFDDIALAASALRINHLLLASGRCAAHAPALEMIGSPAHAALAAAAPLRQSQVNPEKS
jgi:beta-N-acetylhexosaminidase